MKMGPISIFPIKITEENQEFSNDAVLKKGPVEILEPLLGTIGRSVFEKLNLFLDCQQKALAICDSLETLQNHGYFKHSFTQTPILSNRGSIDFEAFSVKGTIRCILDTGCTKNLVNSRYNQLSEAKINLDAKGNCLQKFNASNEDLFAFEDKEELSLPLFRIGTKDFGPVDFLQMSCPMNIEAIIGMDFISTHAIFIDFKRSLLYIEESQQNSALKYPPTAPQKD